MGEVRAFDLWAAAVILALSVSAAPAAVGEGPPAPPAAGNGAGQPTSKGVPASAFFKGKLVSMKGRRVELAYDFADPAQAQDWSPTHPFVEPPTSGGWRVEGGALRADGNGAYRHRAVFLGEVRLRGTLTCEDARNFGALVLDLDSSAFTLFGLADYFFTTRDRRLANEHMVTTFLPPGSGPSGATLWRYVQTTREPRLSGEPVKIDVRKKGARNDFAFAGAGRLGGDDAEGKVGPKIVPAFYTLGSRVVVDDVTVSGVLDADWLRESGIEFEEKAAEDEPEAPPAPSPGPGAPPGGVPPAGGATAAEWQRLVDKISDAAAPRSDREAAVAALLALKERHAARRMIDLLYREEDPVGRELGIKVFKGLTGKECGFSWNAPKEAREKAFPAVWKAWYALRTALEKEDDAKSSRDKEAPKK